MCLVAVSTQAKTKTMTGATGGPADINQVKQKQPKKKKRKHMTVRGENANTVENHVKRVNVRHMARNVENVASVRM